MFVFHWPLQLTALTVQLGHQILYEAPNVQFDETGIWKCKCCYKDEDEIKMEQQEWMQGQKLNQEFRQFFEKIINTMSSTVGIICYHIITLFTLWPIDLQYNWGERIILGTVLWRCASSYECYPPANYRLTYPPLLAPLSTNSKSHHWNMCSSCWMILLSPRTSQNCLYT